jgi:hypothetical protein
VSYDPVIDCLIDWILTLRDTRLARITIRRSVTTTDTSGLSDKLSNNDKIEARHQGNSSVNSSVAISPFSWLSLKRV